MSYKFDLGIDLVHDHVEQELIRVSFVLQTTTKNEENLHIKFLQEIDAIKSSQHKLREMVKNLDKQNA